MIFIDKMVVRESSIIITWRPENKPRAEIFVSTIKLTDNGVTQETIYKNLTEIYKQKQKNIKLNEDDTLPIR